MTAPLPPLPEVTNGIDGPDGPWPLFSEDQLKSYAKLAVREALEAERAKPNEWKEAIIERLIVSCIYQNKHDDDPECAICDLIEWETQVALDPKVSSQAQELIDRGAASERAKQAEPVAWAVFDDKLGRMTGLFDSPCEGSTPLYAAPPAVQDEPTMTNDELAAAINYAKLQAYGTTGSTQKHFDEHLGRLLKCQALRAAAPPAVQAVWTQEQIDAINAKVPELLAKMRPAPMADAAPPADDEAVRLLREAQNALLDYVDRLEKQGGMMNYGRSVLKAIDAYLAKVSK